MVLYCIERHSVEWKGKGNEEDISKPVYLAGADSLSLPNDQRNTDSTTVVRTTLLLYIELNTSNFVLPLHLVLMLRR